MKSEHGENGVYRYPDDIDLRTIDITKEEDQKWISEKIDNFIEESIDNVIAENALDLWQQIELYAEGIQVPLGASSDVLTNFVNSAIHKGVIDKTKFRTAKDKTTQQLKYFVDNKVGQVIDGLMATFGSAKKHISVENDTFDGNDGIEFGVDKAFQKFETDKQWWEQVRLPAIRYMNKLGLGWTYTGYNPRINVPNGDVYMEYYHPKDVLKDPIAVKDFFKESRFVIRRKRQLLPDVRKMLKSLNADLSLATQYSDRIDTGYLLKRGEDLTKDLWQTTYHFELRQKYIDKVKLGEVSEFAGEFKDEEIEVERIYYFEGIFVGKKVVEFKLNKYADPDDVDNWQFGCVPYPDKFSAITTFPDSVAAKLLSAQDVVNIMESIVLDNVIQRNALRLLVVEKLEKVYGKQMIEDFLFKGGVFTVEDKAGMNDIKKQFGTIEFPSLPQETLMFLNMVDQSIKDNSLTHESLTGEYPNKGSISGVAISKLQNANLRKLSYKETNINWSPTQEARRIYRIMAIEYDEAEFIKITNQEKDDPKYIPIQATMNLEEYENFLRRAYQGMTVEQAADIFERNNDVKIFYPKTDKGRIPVSVEQARLNSIVLVNHLKDGEGEVYKLSIKVTMDLDAERNKMEDLVTATMMYEKGDMALPTWLDFKGGIFKTMKNKIIDERYQANKELQMANEIMKRGDQFAQIVAQQMQEYDKKVAAIEELRKKGYNEEQIKQAIQGKGQPV